MAGVANFLIHEEDGTMTTVPMLTFKIGLFDRETYVLIGADLAGNQVKVKQPGMTAERLGKLSELRETLRLEITEQMIAHEWPCATYPDPDVIMAVDVRPGFNRN